MSTRSVAPALFMFAVCHLRGGRSWKTWDSDFLLLSDSLFHMETLMEMRQFQFTENGLSVNTLIADERSPLLDGMERRVSSTVSLRCTANSKRESVVLNLSIITSARLNRWGSVECLFEAWSTSNHFRSLHYSHAYHVLTLFFVSENSPFSITIFSRYQLPQTILGT